MKFLPILFPVAVGSLLLSAVVLAEQQTQREEAALDRPLLRVRLTVHNPGSTMKHLVQVGVRSSVIGGRFECLSGARVPPPLADYVVRYHVRTPETLIRADPVLQLPPGDTMAFTVSLVPSATGSCGSWQAMTTVVAIFSDGTRMVTPPEILTSSDVTAYERRVPGLTELTDALKHRDPEVRAAAVAKVPSAILNEDSRRQIIAAKLSDDSRAVRVAAAHAAAELKLNGVEQELIAAFNQMTEFDETQAYARAFASIGSPRFVDAVVDRLFGSGANCSDCFWFADMLARMQRPDVAAKVLARLLTRIDALVSRAERDDRYEHAISVLIKYRSVDAIDVLQRIIADSVNDDLVNSMIVDLDDLVNGEHVTDPFVLSMYSAVEKASRRAHDLTRGHAFAFLLQLPLDVPTRAAILTRALQDKDYSIREDAAWRVRKEDQFAEGLLRAGYRNARRSTERESFCRGLKVIGKRCN